jgi:AbrB family looped-hinge helix DNA binding protein
MMKTKVSTKGQITLPKAVREQFGITEGLELSISIQDHAILLEKIVPQWRRWHGALAGSETLRDLEREHRDEIERDEVHLRNA